MTDVWEKEGIEAGIRNYTEIRKRLRNPPNAVPDKGISLKKPKEIARPEPPEPPIEQPSPDRIAERVAKILASFPPLGPKHITIYSIINCVSKSFCVSNTDLLPSIQAPRPSRKIRFVIPRQVSFYLAKRLTKRSLPEIAYPFGYDHTSVIHGIKKITMMMQEDPDLAAKVAAIEADLRARYADNPEPSVPANCEPPMEVRKGEGL
jgi:hypothetical protein